MHDVVSPKRFRHHCVAKHVECHEADKRDFMVACMAQKQSVATTAALLK